MKGAAIGSWIPDLQDTKIGSGDIDNHVLKMKPYEGSNKTRFIKKRNVLFDELGQGRKVREFLDDWDSVLGAAWWNKAYKAEPSPGQHLANRSMALTTTLIDQLILGDKKVAALVPGTVKFSNKLDMNARSRKEEVAMYCFMLSHFVADSCSFSLPWGWECLAGGLPKALGLLFPAWPTTYSMEWVLRSGSHCYEYWGKHNAQGGLCAT